MFRAIFRVERGVSAVHGRAIAGAGYDAPDVKQSMFHGP
jgi:hypothetical protein